MKTVGEILKKTRLAKRLSLKKIAKLTRIRQEYLLALEENRYQDLPSFAYAQGFIKNYSQALGLESRPLLAIFRRDYQERKKAVFRLPDEGGFHWTPKLTLLALLIIGIFFFSGYLFWQYRSLLNSPYRP